ncbi:MAG: hypothetical protein GY820_22130 [Gammaproteobacteria bacterium]|nr:hypothetical protein [Gammaproteobacteria bacterium]
MAERLLEQKKAIRKYALENSNISDLSSNEWTLLHSLVELLRPIESASRFVRHRRSHDLKYDFWVVLKILTTLGES